jgi:hypothetical protein
MNLFLRIFNYNYSFSIDNIDIDLNKKLQNLRLLCQRMTASNKNQRPNCDQISTVFNRQMMLLLDKILIFWCRLS